MHLLLTEREVQMLGYLASFGGKHIAEAITDKLTHEFSKEEWDKLWTIFRTELEAASARFRDTKKVFTGEWRVNAEIDR